MPKKQIQELLNEEMVLPEEREETVEEKIAGITAERDQMLRMIDENIRLIAEGDDVEGRTYLKAHLEKEVEKRNAELKSLQG